MPDYNKLQKTATQVRRDILRMVNTSKSGHPGGSLGCTDYLVALYNEVLEHDSKNFSMDGKNEDIFILSNGHIAPALYSVLAHSGYFSIDELGTLRQLGSRLQGHPSVSENLPGIRIASGSLGQGLSVALGVAQTKKLNNDDKLVYCLMGDGEIEEGQVWEAAMYAAAKEIDNIIATVDYNGKQIDGPVEEVLSLGDIEAKWESFGWQVLTMDGNNMRSIIETMNKAKRLSGRGKPVMIIMKTEMGFGVDFMMGTHEWHGVAPDDEQLSQALQQLEETLRDY